MQTEQQLIQRIARAIPSNACGEALRLGLGDDAAVIGSDRKSSLAVSCDAFMEGTHFLADTPPDSVGYKSLVRAASDLVAMGTKPRFFFLCLALPSGATGRWLTAFLQGMRQAARLLDMCLAGGDTTRSRSIAITVTVLGEVPARGFVTRAGAKAGDAIYISGRLGAAQLGLELIHRGLGNRRRFGPLLRPHLYPVIPTSLGEWLGRSAVPSAMMDISDGFSTDLARLCAASGVGARVWKDRIPCVEIPPMIASQMPGLRLDPLRMALHGGDDYELLFTVPPSRKVRLQRAPGFSALTQVGEITAVTEVMIGGADRRFRTLKPRGWDPFRKR